MCAPCERSSRRRGRHRAHPCQRGGTLSSLGYVCSCPCNAPSPMFTAPPECNHTVTVRGYIQLREGDQIVARATEQSRRCLDCGVILPDDQPASLGFEAGQVDTIEGTSR